MSMVINHNIPALVTLDTVNSTSSALEKSIKKLSTGLRINSAADDAAGLAISEKMRAQISGLDQAVKNTQDGISLIQTAEGALSSTHSILQRMRELSVQAANDTLTQQDRSYIQEEIDQLVEEIDHIGNTTTFNTKNLLNGDSAVLWSSSDSTTKALVKGGLRTIDAYGQKSTVEGNYNIKITATPGQGEVQKSDIFTIKHPNSLSKEYINQPAGVNGVTVSNLPAADYKVVTGGTGGVASAAVALTGVFNVDTNYTSNDATITAEAISAAGDYTATLVINGQSVSHRIAGAATDATAAATAIANAFNGTQGAVVTSSGATVKISSTDYSFSVKASAGAATTNSTESQITATFGSYVTASAGSQADVNASILFEVTAVDTTAGTVTLKASAKTLGTDGSLTTTTKDGIMLSSGATYDLSSELGLGESGAFSLKLNGSNYAQRFHEGSKFTYNLSPKDTAANALKVTVSATKNDDWPDKWSNAPTRSDLSYVIEAKASGATGVAGKDVHLQHYYLNENTGEVYEGDIVLSTDSENFTAKNAADQTLTTFHANYVGETANSGTKLRDLDKFWDSQGNFMLEDPQTITINQGDGKSVDVTLYAYDTLGDVATKLNDAIGTGLGQAVYLTNNGNGVDQFVTFVNDGKQNTSESVEGTFVIRSLIPGSNGTLNFAAKNENVLNAFSLNTIQNAKDSEYTVSINDAHSGESIASNVKVTGNVLYGVLHENVDVEFDAMAGVSADWNNAQKRFIYNTKDYTTTLHLADNSMIFQIGANEGDDMAINIGDMRAHALGVDRVLVTDRESAGRSITIIDNAIDKVSTQRSKLGAYQNRLEYTASNLTIASENLTSSESRIRDTDMASEMVNFTKLQIMLQAGTSMLAQANQLPQNVLSLVR